MATAPSTVVGNGVDGCVCDDNLGNLLHFPYRWQCITAGEMCFPPNVLYQVSSEVHSGWCHCRSQTCGVRMLQDLIRKHHFEALPFGGKGREKVPFGNTLSWPLLETGSKLRLAKSLRNFNKKIVFQIYTWEQNPEIHFIDVGSGISWTFDPSCISFFHSVLASTCEKFYF